MKAQRIKKELNEFAPEIFQGHNILFAYLYGSVVSNQFHRFSDLDTLCDLCVLSEAGGEF